MSRGTCQVVVGAQWGDEGKGKIVDVLAREADVIARYQGGANAGHTVVVGSERFVLHQVPSGILHSEKVCLLGNGVVLDPVRFFEEVDGLERRGIATAGRLKVSNRAHLLLSYHKLLDAAKEGSRASGAIEKQPSPTRDGSKTESSLGGVPSTRRPGPPQGPGRRSSVRSC